MRIPARFFFLVGNGTDEVYDRVEYKYNRQAQRIELKDQNGTIHQYEYDALGRATDDKVAICGPGVDGTVRRVSRTYEVRGMPENITTYDSTGGNAVNEVRLEYNDLGMLSKEYQEHEGAKDANTLYTAYNYDDTAAAGEFTKGLRLTSLRYPNGRLVHYTYGSSGSGADVLDRLDAIKDDNGGSPNNTLAAYSWLGLGTMVIEDFAEPDVKLDYYGGSEGTYAGFDRFGRVVQQLWTDYGASADRDKYTYGYDRAGNRTYRELTTSSAKDEYYTYDGINRLVNFDRGDLNVGKTAISGTPAREEDFTLDPTGNWTGYVEKTSGGTDLNQSRTQNQVNEITDITETTGPSWITPAHDTAGNMTTVPKPSDPANGLTCKYDARNRLVEVKDGATVIGEYEYDGLNRRIIKRAPATCDSASSSSSSSSSAVDTYEHFFYNAAWRILETRNTTTENDHPEGLQPKYQYIGSPRYIDAPILRDENTNNNGLCDNERIYYLSDANFNVTCLVDTAGDAIERYLYDPYGNVTIYTGDWSSTRTSSSYSNPILYTGRELDAETGLMHYRHRYYSVELGRFVSRDPIEYRGSSNLHTYAGDSPIMRVDPMGLWEFTLGFYYGVGGSVGVTVDSGVEDCCLDGRTLTRRADRLEIDVRIGLGLEGQFWDIQLGFHFPLINIRASDNCMTDCGDPDGRACCRACGRVGVNPGFPSVGFAFFDVHFDFQGTLKWCYAYGCANQQNGWAIGLCGHGQLNFSWGIFGIGDGVTIPVLEEECVMLLGTDGMLEE